MIYNIGDTVFINPENCWPGCEAFINTPLTVVDAVVLSFTNMYVVEHPYSEDIEPKQFAVAECHLTRGNDNV